MSPKFLFRGLSMDVKVGQNPVDAYELAESLSYFLGESMPDDELLKLVPTEIYDNKKIGIYFPNDAFLKDYFDKNIFKENKIN